MLSLGLRCLQGQAVSLASRTLGIVPSRGVRIPRHLLDPTYKSNLRKTAPFYQFKHEGELKDDKEDDRVFHQEELTPEQEHRRNEVILSIDEQIKSRSYGRLFVTLHIGGKQRKVSTGDLLMLDHDMGLTVGEQITLDKVLLVGGRDFTLIGRPLLPRDLLRVEATVVERNLSRTKVSFLYRKKVTRGITHLDRTVQTTLRINNIDLLCPIEEAIDRIGYERTNNDTVFV